MVHTVVSAIKNCLHYISPRAIILIFKFVSFLAIFTTVTYHAEFKFSVICSNYTVNNQLNFHFPIKPTNYTIHLCNKSSKEINYSSNILINL